MRDVRRWDGDCCQRLPDVVGREEIAVGLVAEDCEGEVSRWSVAGHVDAYFGQGPGFGGGPGLVELRGWQVAGRGPGGEFSGGVRGACCSPR